MNSSKKRSQQAPANPFEAKWNVLSGASRKRTPTLARRNRQNVFADRRIGEDNPALPEEDRYLARLQRERTRRSKNSSLFNLEDSVPADAVSVGEAPRPAISLLRDDYDENEHHNEDLEDDEIGMEEEDDADEFLTLKKEETVDGDDNREKTHREIMGEVMMKSKMFKAKRQHDKHEMDEQTIKLDDQLPDIMQLLSKSGNHLVRNANDGKVLDNTVHVSIFGDDENDPSEERQRLVNHPLPSGDRSSRFHYESIYQQLASEKRARPSDRLLTEEEKAEKEVSELKRLEALRTERMSNAEELEDDDLINEGRKKSGRKKNPVKARALSGGDDLDDGFDLASPEDAVSDEHDEEEEDPSGLSGDKSNRGLSDFEADKTVKLPKVKDRQDGDSDNLVFIKKQKLSISVGDIPFVFKKCPSTSAELQSMFEERSREERNLILERLRKCFAVSLNPSVNQVKLNQLLHCTLRRIEALTTVSSIVMGTAVAEVDMLLVHVYGLGKGKQDIVSEWARDKLAELYESLTTTKSGKIGLSERWGVGSVVLLRAIGRLFPSSDLRHPVSTPLVLLLSEAMDLERMVTVKDVALGILVGMNLVEQMVESGRYCGQLIRFLCEVIRAAYCDEKQVLSETMRNFRERYAWPDDSCTTPLKVCNVMGDDWTDEDSVQIQAGSVTSAVQMLNMLSFDGKVGHMDILLQSLPLDRIEDTKAQNRLLERVREARSNRRVMTLYTKAGSKAGNRLLNPKFSSENGVFRRKAKTSYYESQNGDVTESAARVRRALRKEERGYARDVRQAAVDRNRTKSHEEGERREKRDKRSRETMAFLEEQQATWKKATKRQKKLSGKKW